MCVYLDIMYLAVESAPVVAALGVGERAAGLAVVEPLALEPFLGGVSLLSLGLVYEEIVVVVVG